MKITFETAQDNGIRNQSDMETMSRLRHGNMQEKAQKAEKMAGYLVNIGNQDRQIPAGGTYKKEAEKDKDPLEDISAMDMDVQKMYMAVMSNSMSPEEFGEMMEDGYNISDIDIETAVTILDQIKVAVAKGGTDIAGFTDTVSKETLEQILGSSAYAEALEGGMEDGSIAYMVGQQMEPTPENLYKAKYSAGSYHGQKNQELPKMNATEEAAFQEQVDQVISEAGLEINTESRQDAAFLLKYDVPLTKENLQLYEKIKPFGKEQERIPEEELKSRIMMQVYEGKAPEQADLSRTESIYEQAAKLYDAVQGLTSEAADLVADRQAAGEGLTLKELIDGQKELQAKAKKPDSNEYGGTEENRKTGLNKAEAVREEPVRDIAMLTARRQLEEVRLRMTVEANIKLLRSNFRIDTMPMEQLIERLKSMEETLAGQGITQAEEAVQKLSELRTMPAEALSYAVNREIPYTIIGLHEKGSSLQADYERAGERYETMQTMPRADLGDSMQKAFRNVDDILVDMNKEPSEENRRAVRMLGYNRLVLTEENLERALEMDRKVQNLFQDMKPGKVLQMIREGVDVLHTDIEELHAYLSAQKSDFLEESGDFARFLHKLDKSGDITPEERESYIGIYRLVRQVEKSDGRAEGYLLGSDAQLTMENLLAAVRSSRKGFMDYRIDESFSGADTVQKGKNIIDQINAAFRDEPAGTAEYKETMQALEEAGRHTLPGESSAVDFLEETGQPVIVSNLINASSVLQEDAGIYQKIEEYEKRQKQEEDIETGQGSLENYVAQLQDSITDEPSLQEGMEKFTRQAEELLREAEGQPGVTELDIRSMQRIYKGIRFRTALSRESRYQIPVKLAAGYAVMNLTVRRGMQEARAEVSINTEKYGRLEGVFTAAGETTGSKISSIRGNLYAERPEGMSLLEEIADMLQENFKSSGIVSDEIQVMQGSRIRQPFYGKMTDVRDSNGGKSFADKTVDGQNKKGGKHSVSDGENPGQAEISTRELYQIAKIFLETVRNEY